MRLFSRLFSIAFPALLLPLGALIVAAVNAVLVFPTYQPGASESLALDRLTRPVTTLSTARSRFMAFIARLGLHALFVGTGSRFDPGRAVA